MKTKKGPLFKKKGAFIDKLVLRRRRFHPEKACECFDCLRKEGLTPPLALRGRHQALYPTQEIRGPGADTPGSINRRTSKRDEDDKAKSLDREDPLASRRV